MQNHMDMYIYLIHGLGMYLIYLNYIHTSQSIDYVGGYKYESHAGWPQGADLRNHFGLVGHLPEATRMKKNAHQLGMLSLDTTVHFTLIQGPIFNSESHNHAQHLSSIMLESTLKESAE